MAGRRSPKRRGESAHIDLRGPQRTWYLKFAAACLAAAAAPALFQLLQGHPGRADWSLPILWALVMVPLAGYYARLAYGWVHIGPAGLHTSRRLRGRFFAWSDIAWLDTRTWYGKGSEVTVVRVGTRAGRTYYLPAPRTTIAASEQMFDRRLRQLRRYLNAR